LEIPEIKEFHDYVKENFYWYYVDVIFKAFFQNANCQEEPNRIVDYFTRIFDNNHTSPKKVIETIDLARRAFLFANSWMFRGLSRMDVMDVQRNNEPIKS